MARATVILGRDGMGDATEEEFARWVAFVCAHIDDAAGFEVEVDERGARDVQDGAVYADEDDRVVVEEAVEALWNRWCSEGMPEVTS
jgi:hypothetical protein